MSVGNLGNISLWIGEKLTWDPDAERIINHPEANQYLTKRIPCVVDAVERLMLVRNMTRIGLTVGRSALLLLLASPLWADEPKWKQHTINGQSEFEAEACST